MFAFANIQRERSLRVKLSRRGNESPTDPTPGVDGGWEWGGGGGERGEALMSPTLVWFLHTEWGDTVCLCSIGGSFDVRVIKADLVFTCFWALDLWSLDHLSPNRPPRTDSPLPRTHPSTDLLADNTAGNYYFTLRSTAADELPNLERSINEHYG